MKNLFVILDRTTLKYLDLLIQSNKFKINLFMQDNCLISKSKLSKYGVNILNENSVDLLINNNIDIIIVNIKLDNSVIETIKYFINNYQYIKDVFCFTNIVLDKTVLNQKLLYYKLIKISTIVDLCFDKVIKTPTNKNIKIIDKTETKIIQTTETKIVKTKETKIEIVKTKETKIETVKTTETKKEKINKLQSSIESEFIDLCISQMEDIRNIDLKNISQNTIYEAVFIDFRILPHTEYIIRNCIDKLDSSWSHTIVCGNDNYDFFKNMCDKIHPNIKIIQLNMSNVTHNMYNNLLLTKEFWNLFNGEYLLIYQSDSLIFKNNIDEFLMYDYIGSPYNKNCNVILAKEQVGNGGLSYRTKSVMLKTLDTIDIKADIYSNQAKQYTKTYDLDNFPEDVYFSQNIQNYNLGIVASYEIAKTFSMDTVYSEDCFGMHCMWHSCSDWKNQIKKRMNPTIIHNNKLFNKKIDSSYFSEQNINFTRKRDTQNDSFLQNLIEYDICNIDKCIIIIDFFNGGGGTTVFLNYIVSKYKYYNNFIIMRKLNNKIYVTLNDDYIIKIMDSEDVLCNFLNNNINLVEKLFVNHIIGFSSNFINFLIKFKTINNIKLYTITHDYIHISKLPQPTYNLFDIANNIVNDNITNDMYSLNDFDEIITQHKTNLDIFDNYIKNKDIIKVVPLPDFYTSELSVINKINKKNIIIGIIGNINELKGYNILKKFIVENININFVVFGNINIKNTNVTVCPYNSVSKLNNLLILHKPNIMLELSIWPETYSFVLTLYSIINLPLLILKKPKNSVIVDRAKELNIEYYILDTIDDIFLYMDKAKYSFNTIRPELKYNNYWDRLFISGYDKNIINTSINNTFLKYAIYFPQFHSFEINNKLFYDGYTDATNLSQLYNSKYLNEIITPKIFDKEYLNICDYDITKNINIINSEFNILKDYNITGLACYYYWFSINSVNNDNMLMRNVVDNLFDAANSFNKNIFFIWANENWTSNAAMGNSNDVSLINNYSDQDIYNNFINLLSYFNNKSYLKIHNKPVLMIYHTFLLSSTEISNYITTLNNLCIDNGFEGIEIYINIMRDNNNISESIPYKKFYINFNYKLNLGFRYLVNEQTVIDYMNYTNFFESHSPENIVQTIVFDFDNNARLFNPNRQKLSTICIKNYHFSKINFIKAVINKYSNENNIVLINSLNEWGEKMAIEPSNELGYYYLNLITKYF
jgi:hypothetical protein